ncbi:MAG: hypothetical protein WBG86_23340 [Polyangiales bacterium]
MPFFNRHFGLFALCVLMACGDANAGEIGPSAPPDGGGEPLSQVRTFELVCSASNLDLVLAIDLAIILSDAFRPSGSNEVTLGAGVTLVEESVEALIEANVPVIDVASMSVRTALTGASPSTMTSTLPNTPVDDFDLSTDPDENGSPGPHRFQLSAVAETATVANGSGEVVFSLDVLRFAFGDFSVPDDCVGGRTLTGVPIKFTVEAN